MPNNIQEIKELIQSSIVEKNQKNIQSRQEILNGLLQLGVDNIKQIRDLIIHFVLIASGIIGFTIPVFGRTTLIRSENFLVAGLVELLLVILYGFYYLKSVLEQENVGLSNQRKTVNKLYDELRDGTHKFLASIPGLSDAGSIKDALKKRESSELQALETFKKDFTQSNHDESYATSIIFVAFVSGLFLILMSFLSSWLAWIGGILNILVVLILIFWEYNQKTKKKADVT